MKYFISTLLLFVVLSARAQYEINDLFQELEQYGEDTNRVNTLNYIAWEYTYSNIDSALIIAKEAQQLSQKLDFAYGTSVAYETIAIIYDIQGNSEKAIEYFMKAIAHEKKIRRS